jgi:hypothetical protein
MSWRTATTTLDTSGMYKFQSAWVDTNGRIISFTSGDNLVEKYIANNSLSVAYKKILPPPTFEMFMFDPSYNNNYYSTDGLTWTAVADLNNSPTLTPHFFNGYWWAGAHDSKVYKSSDKINWTAASGVLSGLPAIRYFRSFGNTNIIGFSYDYTQYAYSNDGGSTWAVSSSLDGVVWGATFIPDGRLVITILVDPYPDNKYCEIDTISIPGQAPTSVGWYNADPDAILSNPFWYNGKLHYGIHSEVSSQMRIVYVNSIPSLTFTHSGTLFTEYAYDEAQPKIFILNNFYMLAGTSGDTAILDSAGNNVAPSGLLIFSWGYNTIDQKVYIYSGESGGLYRGRVHSSSDMVNWEDVTAGYTGGPVLEYGTFLIGTRT